MIDVGEVRSLVENLSKKKRRGFINTSEFNKFMNFASRAAFAKRLGVISQYQPARPVPPVASDQTQKVRDDLQPFIKQDTINLDRWYLDFPYDYAHLIFIEPAFIKNKDGCAITPDGKIIPDVPDVKIVSVDEWSKRINSNIVYPTYSKPIARQLNKRLEFSPSDLPQVKLTYYCYPQDAEWVGDVVNNREVYNPVTSTQLQWDAPVFNDLVLLICGYFGMNLQQFELDQWSDKTTQSEV
jgi:hypothetical protein